MNETMVEPAVVVGTDGSAPADAAVVWAADEAVERGRPLHIVHVEVPWVYSDVPAPNLDKDRAEQSHILLARAEELAVGTHRGLAVTVENLRGPLVQTLRDSARGSEELVLGKRGRGGFTDLLLGSTSLRIAGHTDRPVVVVRGDNAVLHGEIVVGVSFEHDPTPALDFAFEAARARKATLRAVHVWEPADDLITIVVGAPDFADPLERLAGLLHPWKERNIDVEVVEELDDGHPVGALSAASAGADLLVVGSHGRGTLGGALLGSAGHGLLHHARCPVAIVPTPSPRTLPYGPSLRNI